MSRATRLANHLHLNIEPTFSPWEIAELLGKSRDWVDKRATRHEIGEQRQGQRRFTKNDLVKLQHIAQGAKIGNPNWTQGKPQAHRKKKEV
tara:strand:- start:219 stop:491 length:273 start_codon:yes stop_codon:yes gene_type:complete